MMKKIIMMMALILSLAVSANAQTALVDNGTVKDNWYIGGGIGTNVWNDATSWTMFNANSMVHNGSTNSWWRTQPLHANVIVGKMFNPYLGAEVDYTGIFNLNGQNAFIDAHNLTGNLVVNLTNTLAGYDGKRRAFEVELVGGAGWMHNFNEAVYEKDVMTVRGAIRGNFNLGKSWAITITPEYVWTPKNIGNVVASKQGANLSVGVKYRIPSARGNFPLKKLYDQSEIDALTQTINTLQTANLNLTKTNANLSEVINKLINEGDKVIFKSNSVGIVTFEQGKYNVNSADIETIVGALSKSSGKIVLTGTTSPEGTEKSNRALGINRANAVKKALVDGGIDENRIIIKNEYSNQRNVLISIE